MEAAAANCYYSAAYGAKFQPRSVELLRAAAAALRDQSLDIVLDAAYPESVKRKEVQN